MGFFCNLPTDIKLVVQLFFLMWISKESFVFLRLINFLFLSCIMWERYIDNDFYKFDQK